MSFHSTPHPVVLFTFNRPEVTEITLRRVVEANPTKIYFVQDGPRGGNKLDHQLVQQVRKLVHLIPEGIEVITIFSESNLGLRSRFFKALDEVFDREEAAIIIEDDCLVELSFFTFAARCLDFYQEDKKIVIVSSHRPVSFPGNSSVVFDEVTRIWGWATWADRWKAFRACAPANLADHDSRAGLLAKIRSTTWRIMARSLFTAEMSSNSWAVGLSIYALQNGLLSVSPPRNAVTNLGALGGTHSQDWAFVELPKSKPVLDGTKFNLAKIRPNTHVCYEDLVRVGRWSIAAAKRPGKALKKLNSLLFKR